MVKTCYLCSRLIHECSFAVVESEYCFAAAYVVGARTAASVHAVGLQPVPAAGAQNANALAETVLDARPRRLLRLMAMATDAETKEDKLVARLTEATDMYAVQVRTKL